MKLLICNCADCIILWTGTGGGFWRNIFPFSQLHVLLYIHKIWLVRRILWLIRNKLKVLKASRKLISIRYLSGLDLRFLSLHSTLFTTVPRIQLLNEKSKQKKSKLFSNQTNMKILHTNSSKILLLTNWLGKKNLISLYNNIGETYMCIELMFLFNQTIYHFNFEC